ncbi:MAG: glycoside hydrolase family 2, partial [Elusimicrobia bacterium]|nr:glycoside hydrolase family 2 [Elusimicrobiota bacterium]
APAAIELTADRDSVSPSWDDVDRVTARVVDAHGVQVPTASNLVTFAADGPGAVVAVDNGDNASHESFQASQRSAYEGRCVAFVRATAPGGTITLHASAPGLTPATITISAAK